MLSWQVESWPGWVEFCIEHIRDICFWTSTPEIYWWQVNFASGNGLVPSGNKPLPEPKLTQIYVVIYCDTRPQWVKLYSFETALLYPEQLGPVSKSIIMDSSTRENPVVQIRQSSDHLNGFSQHCCNSIANAPELPQSCFQPSILSPQSGALFTNTD